MKCFSTMINLKCLFSLNVFTFFFITYLCAQNLDYYCATTPKTLEEMKTLPYYGNNSYLDDLGESLGVFDNRFSQNDFFNIPVQFWLNGESDPDAEIQDDQFVQLSLDWLNQLFAINNTKIRFHIRDCKSLYTRNLSNNFLELNMDDSYEKLDNMINLNNSPDVLNVYYVNSIKEDFLTVAVGLYHQTNEGKEGIVLNRTKANYRSTLAHEVGHYFGLEHTFKDYLEGKCHQESVNRFRAISNCEGDANGCYGCEPKYQFNCENFSYCDDNSNNIEYCDENLENCCEFCEDINCSSSDCKKNCEFNGDALCQTPGDIRKRNIVNCEYVDDFIDHWGDFYDPAISNIMSYSEGECRNSFVDHQIVIMTENVLKRGYELQSNSIFDEYEPNDNYLLARELKLEEAQYHTNSIKGCFRDEDWFWFSVTGKAIGSNYNFFTSKGSLADLDTEIYLYKLEANKNLIEISYNDDSNGSKYSSVEQPRYNLLLDTILVQVKFKYSPSEISDYKIQVKQICPLEELCIQGNYKTGEQPYFLGTELIYIPCFLDYYTSAFFDFVNPTFTANEVVVRPNLTVKSGMQINANIVRIEGDILSFGDVKINISNYFTVRSGVTLPQYFEVNTNLQFVECEEQ